MVLGTIFGTFGGTIQSEKLGRRYSIMIDCCTNLVATFMLALASNFATVLVARFLQGYSIGSGRVAIPIYTRYHSIIMILGAFKSTYPRSTYLLHYSSILINLFLIPPKTPDIF